MNRVSWQILLALLAGLGIGLVYSWSISPLRVVDAHPSELRADFKDAYRSAIAAAYAANNNLPRAQARLSLLKDPNPIDALNAQAQRMAGNSDAFEHADQVAALALALTENREPAPATKTINTIQVTSTVHSPPSPANAPVILTQTPPGTELPSIEFSSTPRPTETPSLTPGVPFSLTGQEKVCDTNLPEGMLEIIVVNSNRRQMPGMEIIITWDGGEDQFFTGLKPELGNGYADYIMLPDIAYTVQLAAGSDIATGLAPPECQAPGGSAFVGGIKLTFQQP